VLVLRCCQDTGTDEKDGARENQIETREQEKEKRGKEKCGCVSDQTRS
jgi:hypothetical protein